MIVVKGLLYLCTDVLSSGSWLVHSHSIDTGIGYQTRIITFVKNHYVRLFHLWGAIWSIMSTQPPANQKVCCKIIVTWYRCWAHIYLGDGGHARYTSWDLRWKLYWLYLFMYYCLTSGSGCFPLNTPLQYKHDKRSGIRPIYIFAIHTWTVKMEKH